MKKGKGDKSNRTKLYELFDRGYDYKSVEAKSIGLKYESRKRYFFQWREERGKTSGLSKPKGKTGTVSAPLPGGESIGTAISDSPLNVSPSVKPSPLASLQPEVLSSPAESPNESYSSENGDKEEKGDTAMDARGAGMKPGKPSGLPDKVIGMGIPVNVYLSVKTLFLWEHARQILKNNGSDLPLGDFLDAAVEDMYQVRGTDAGIIKIGG